MTSANPAALRRRSDDPVRSQHGEIGIAIVVVVAGQHCRRRCRRAALPSSPAVTSANRPPPFLNARRPLAPLVDEIEVAVAVEIEQRDAARAAFVRGAGRSAGSMAVASEKRTSGIAVLTNAGSAPVEAIASA